MLRAYWPSSGPSNVSTKCTPAAGTPSAADAASGYDPQTDTYTLEFTDGPAYAGDTVHAGLCTDSPVLQRPATGNVPRSPGRRPTEASRPIRLSSGSAGPGPVPTPQEWKSSTRGRPMSLSYGRPARSRRAVALEDLIRA